MYCEKCCRIIEGDRCPVCKKSRVRQPEPKDLCFLTEQNYISSTMLEDVLHQENIPFLKKGLLGAGLAIKVGPMLEWSRFYVPFEILDSAKSVVEELFEGNGEEESEETEE